MRQKGFDIAQDLTRLLQLTARQTRFTHQEVQRALGIHQTQTHFPADIFLLRQRRQRFVVLIALMAFHDHAAQLFQIAVDVFDFVRQLFNFGFEQVEQQFVGVAVNHCLAAGAHTVETKCRQFTFTQGEQTTIANGKRNGGVTGVVFRIFIEEEGVDMQAVFVFKETRGGLDVFQFRAGRQALPEL
ncbi:hypothetical protein D3C81_212520 [compost metagenome]